MKQAIVLLLCLSACADPALFVFSRDGVSSACSPRELPSIGTRLADPASTVVLHAATTEDRAACGWYPAAAPSEPVPSFSRVVSRKWTLTNGVAVEVRTYAPIVRNVELSKYKLLVGLDEIGALDAFVAYLAADAKRKLLWDAAVTLDSTNALVVAAADELSSAFGSQAVSNLLWKAKIR